MRVIVAVTLDVVFTENMAKREKVDDEQEGHEDRTLGYARGEGGWWETNVLSCINVRNRPF